MTRPPVSAAKLLHFAIAGVSPKAVKAAIGDQQHIADGIRLLCRLDRVVDLELTALVFSVGEQDHGLASYFFRELIVGGQIDRVVEHRPFGSWNCTAKVRLPLRGDRRNWTEGH